jgi:hypothetical protein
MNPVTLRRWHSYIGLLIAPSVLFFAVTGALQIFDLHQVHDGYRPPVLLEKFGAVHRDQVFEQPPEHHPEDEAGAAATKAPSTHALQPPQKETMRMPTMALKWFFALVAVGLTVSTVIGVWIGLTQVRAQAIAWTLLSAGVAIPVILLMV